MSIKIAESINVFAQTITAVLEARFQRIEAALAALEQRIQRIELSNNESVENEIVKNDTVEREYEKPETSYTNEKQSESAITNEENSIIGPYSWYSLTVVHPSTINNKSPDHLLGIMYNIIKSKACEVKEYAAIITLEDGNPVLQMLMHIGKTNLQTHFIQRWNDNQKNSIKCHKLKHLDKVIEEFKTLRSDIVSAEMRKYRESYPNVFENTTRWGNLTQEYILS